jgi:poly-beta-hydroxybutyrate-responsive repressor
MAAQQKIEARPRNWLTPVTLVLLREESSYGYELMERLEEEFGFEQIRAGTLYRTLRQTEKEGLCKSEWDTSESGPARRMYSITEAGEEYLCEHNPCRTIGIMPMIGLPLLRSLFTITVTTTRWVFLGVYRGQAQHGQTKNPCKRGLWGAAGLGFEPRLTDPESVVLPLHHPAIQRGVL